MSGKQYLEMDINKLFEENSIKEIQNIQKKIQVESDWKKVELRTLVGERYRDLIQAADTIAEMQKTTESVIQRISDVEGTLKILQQKYLIGFKFDPEKSLDNKNQTVSDSVIVQIKVLMDIPEHIWSAIDNRDLLKATQLFILAQHINYSLTFEVGQSVLTLKYPIVHKQWSIISNFRRIIFEECNRTLQLIDLSPEVAANCLACLLLMEKTKSSDLLEKLINLRSNAIESIIKNESPHSVRQRIKLSVKLLSDTVALIHSCFINANNRQMGLIAQYMKTIMDQEASDMLLQFDLNNELIRKYLPTVTKTHKLFTKGEFVELSIPDIHEHFKNWLTWVRKFTSFEISRLLQLVTSVRGIYNIREESISVELPEDWTNIWKDLSHPAINFWTEFFHPLLTERVKEIVNNRWAESLASLKTNIINFLAKLNNDKFDYPEHDLRWFVWKDSPTDIPQKLFKSSSLDVRRSLLMKARGYTPNLVNLCEKFDESLQTILVDLELYLYETDKLSSVTDNLLSINLSSVFDKFSDRTVIQEDLQRVSALMIGEIITFIKAECLIENAKNSRSEKNVIVMARFLQALTALCPNLNKCFTLSKVSGLTITNIKWQSICDKARDESTSLWALWARHFMTQVKDEHVKKFIHNDPFDGLSVKTIISEWEKVTIEEEAEEGKRIKSEILVPYQPSLSLQKFLASVIKDLNKVVPHTIPKKVIHELVDNIVHELFIYYEDISKNKSMRQKQAFQVLLDIKYIALLMVARENKKLVDKTQELCNNVLEKIDPFDSDVFYPFIHINVKKSVQRSLLIFGNLVPHMEQLHSVLGARSELGDSGKSIANPPGVLAICTGAPWFPPLAVTVPSRNLPLIAVTIPDKVQRKKTPVKEHSRNDSTGATIKSGAAAFFGAMGSDWFSTS